MGFELLSKEETQAYLDAPQPPRRRGPQPQCPGCGRFAKWLRGEHYYNGWFNCYRFYTSCSRCGECSTECV